MKVNCLSVPCHHESAREYVKPKHASLVGAEPPVFDPARGLIARNPMAAENHIVRSGDHGWVGSEDFCQWGHVMTGMAFEVRAASSAFDSHGKSRTQCCLPPG